MIINDIYRDKILKYPLTEEEYNLIPKVWKFLKIFKKRFTFISDYRNYVIKKINKKYTPQEFYKYEAILNKMFWNLRWLLFPLWSNQYLNKSEYKDFIKNNYDNLEKLPDYLLLCNFQKYSDSDDLKNKYNMYLNESYNYYRSFINKIIMVDKPTKTLITKPMEGSSDIFLKNYFNLFTSQVHFTRSMYEAIVEDPFIVKYQNIELAKFYYQFDYGFPNLNYCTYFFGTDEDRLNRIKKMYYTPKPKRAKYWFKLII
jgi:hypothetical protein